MPFGDGTGPARLGPMTGRVAGLCAGYGVPGYMNPMSGRGYGGWGRGGGRGWRHWFYATGLPRWARGGWPAWGDAVNPYAYGAPLASAIAPQQELDGLKSQAEYFEDALNGIKKRIEDLEGQTSSKEATG